MLDLLLSKYTIIGGILLLILGKVLKVFEIYQRLRSDKTSQRIESDIKRNKEILDDLHKKSGDSVDAYRKLRDKFFGKGR